MTTSERALVKHVLETSRNAQVMYEAGMITLGEAENLMGSCERLLEAVAPSGIYGLAGQEEALAMKSIREPKEGDEIL